MQVLPGLCLAVSPRTVSSLALINRPDTRIDLYPTVAEPLVYYFSPIRTCRNPIPA